MYTGKRRSYNGCFKAFQNDLMEREGIYEIDIKNNFISNKFNTKSRFYCNSHYYSPSVSDVLFRSSE